MNHNYIFLYALFTYLLKAGSIRISELQRIRRVLCSISEYRNISLKKNRNLKVNAALRCFSVRSSKMLKSTVEGWFLYILDFDMRVIIIIILPHFKEFMII